MTTGCKGTEKTAKTDSLKEEVEKPVVLVDVACKINNASYETKVTQPCVKTHGKVVLELGVVPRPLDETSCI